MVGGCKGSMLHVKKGNFYLHGEHKVMHFIFRVNASAGPAPPTPGVPSVLDVHNDEAGAGPLSPLTCWPLAAAITCCSAPLLTRPVGAHVRVGERMGGG